MVIAPQKATGVPIANPHGEPPRGPLGSAVVLLGVFSDYWLGYIFVIRPVLARAGLVVFDRYYHDVLVDPLRYRYGGPMWLPRMLSRFVPLPDLSFLVLDADEDVILSRKRELPPEELRRQREGYQQFTGGDKRASLIRTDQGIEATVEKATRFVAEALSQRFQRRHADWLISKS
jgi:thymidylate kinase